MCGLCAALGSAQDWSDEAGRREFAEASSRGVRRIERENRVALLNAILRHCRFHVADWGGNSYVIENEAGKSANAYNLGGIWAAIDQLTPPGMAPPDPLDPALLAAIGTGAA